LLREAIADGFKDVNRLRDDPELEPLRSSPEFQLMVLDLDFPGYPIKLENR
jgi:hypothetical protein